MLAHGQQTAGRPVAGTLVQPQAHGGEDHRDGVKQRPVGRTNDVGRGHQADEQGLSPRTQGPADQAVAHPRLARLAPQLPLGLRIRSRALLGLLSRLRPGEGARAFESHLTDRIDGVVPLFHPVAIPLGDILHGQHGRVTAPRLAVDPRAGVAVEAERAQHLQEVGLELGHILVGRGVAHEGQGLQMRVLPLTKGPSPLNARPH